MLLWTVHIWAIVEALHHHQLVDFVSFRYLNVIDDLAKSPLSMWPESGWIRIPSKLKSNTFSKRKKGRESGGLATYHLVLWGFEIRKAIKLGQSMGHWPFYRLVICAAQWKRASFHFNQPIQIDQIKFAGNFWDTMLASSFLVLRLEMAPFWLEKARSCKCVG